MVGDRRWAGAYGVQADFVAMSHCSVEYIKTEDIMVLYHQAFYHLCISILIQLSNSILYLQDILEKFEFFPIKCRIQRAKDTYSKFEELVDNSRQVKSKVCVFLKTNN